MISANGRLKAALSYARRGWPVLPIHTPAQGKCSCLKGDCPHPGKHPRTQHGLKDATTDESVIRRWWDMWPDANVAVATGAASGLVALDIDPRHGGDKNLQALEARHGPLPVTVTAHTGGGGFHKLFVHPGGRVKNCTGDGALAPGVEVKGDGGYIVVAPSLHVSGQPYVWEIGAEPDEFPIAILPGWLLELIDKKAKGKRTAKRPPEGKRIREGGRNDTLASLAGTMRRPGMSKEAIAAALIEENAQRCDPPLQESEVLGIAESVSRYEPSDPVGTPPGEDEDSHAVSDDIAINPARIAQWILEEEGQHLARDAGGKLYIFEGGVYCPKGMQRIRALVKQFFLTVGKAEKWNSHKAQEVIQFILADAPELWEVPPFDRINVLNGILDLNRYLATGDPKHIILLPHAPEHLSPIQLPVAYDPCARCLAWERQVEATFPDDAWDLAWEILGWLMAPLTSIQRAILCLGEGGTGKSTFLAAVKSFLGRRNVSAKTLHRLESNRFSVAGLFGKLANICADLPSQDLSGTAMFKSLTGGDEITGEHKFLSEFSFTPFARLIFSANRPPKSNDPSEAFFERWVVVPFDKKYRGEKGEISRQKLDALLAQPEELSGVLNKALAALPKVLEQGFTVSPSMKEAHRIFREGTDPVLVWIQTNVVDSPLAVIGKQDVLAAYNRTAISKGRPVETDKAFTQALKRWNHLLAEGQRTWKDKPKTPCWLGIGLRGGPGPEEKDVYPSRHSRDSRVVSQLSNGESPPESDMGSQGSKENTTSRKGLNPLNPLNRASEDCRRFDSDQPRKSHQALEKREPRGEGHHG